MILKTLDIMLCSESAPATFPNGCHVREVEVDPETGVVDVVKYTGRRFRHGGQSDDRRGPVHGGVVQGIGQA